MLRGDAILGGAPPKLSGPATTASDVREHLATEDDLALEMRWTKVCRGKVWTVNAGLAADAGVHVNRHAPLVLAVERGRVIQRIAARYFGRPFLWRHLLAVFAEDGRSSSRS
jgi:hypothetical protein